MAPRLRSNLLYENDDIERIGTFEKQGTFANLLIFSGRGNEAERPGQVKKICQRKCTIEILRCVIGFDPSVECAKSHVPMLILFLYLDS